MKPTRAGLRRVVPRALAVLLSAGIIASAVRPAEGRAPTCEEWQTVTQLPVPDSARPSAGSSTGTPRPRTTPVCRNAPPRPFPQPAWAPESVIGGSRLAASGVVVDLPPGVAPPPQVPDVAYVVADLHSGQVLAAKSPHAWLRPASTLKTLTAFTLIPRLDPERRVLARAEHEAANGTRVGILAGNRYPIGKLFDALLLASANDAAYLLADAAGGYDATVALMNETAAGLGAHDTVVLDPSGLDEDGQRSSAYDLALIGRAAMSLPTFRGYVIKPHAMFPGGRTRPRAGSIRRSRSRTSTICCRATRALSGSSPDGPTGRSTPSSALPRGAAGRSSSRSWAAPPAAGRTPRPCSTGASPTRMP